VENGKGAFFSLVKLAINAHLAGRKIAAVLSQHTAVAA
jgi:hypothetical protein